MMSDGSLTQAEIDALLQDSNEINIQSRVEREYGDEEIFSASPPPPSLHKERHKERLEEITTDIVKTVAKAAKKALGTNCSLTLLESEIADISSLGNALDVPLVQIAYTTSTGSIIIYLLTEEHAAMLASYVIGQDDLKIDDFVFNALQESFSQLSAPLLQQLSAEHDRVVEIEDTATLQSSYDDLAISSTPLAINTYELTVKKDKIIFYEIFEVALLEDEERDATALTPQAVSQPMPEAVSQPRAARKSDDILQSVPIETPAVKPVMLNDFGAGSPYMHQGNLDLLMDVEMQLTVELGQTRKQIREILQLGEGSIIELDKLAGEPVDVMVNHQLIAKGEVVVIDENFGVRVTEIISPADRMASLG